jgi:acyl-phosphate glycerol 3-phosphate acyltransferase
MNALPLLVLTLLGSYLVGAVPFGYLVARWRGVDILRQGSGNIGATNVGRLLGRRFGALVFVLDFAKGALPVLAASRLAPDLGPGWPADTLPVAAGVAAFLGHLFPVYLRFHGGKGVATGAGVVSVLLPYPMLGALLAWVVVLAATRYVSLASLTAAAVLCLARLVFTPGPWAPAHRLTTLFCLLAVALVFARHHANIRRLLGGNENRIKDSPAMLLLGKTLHVLALGLWFGTAVFFTFVVGLVLLHTFETEASKPGPERPLWFPEWQVRHERLPGSGLPDPLRKEQGSRAFGAAVGPLFPWYFGTQAVCGLVALATALGWSSARRGEKVHRVRAAVLVLALLGVAGGWWMERVVHGLREERGQAMDAVLLGAEPTRDQVARAEAARAEFGRWHGYSLLVNFATVALVTVGMALAARLPSAAGEGPTAGSKQAPAPAEAGRA